MSKTFRYRNYEFQMRTLTVSEAKIMQAMPDWYTKPDNVPVRAFNKALGNGWNVNVIKHIFSYLPSLDRPLRVLSLFDGISCGLVAFKELNIPIGTYLASEIDKNPMKISSHNFPEIIQIGNVCDIDVDELVEKYGVPDIIIGGSPCKNLSQVGKKEGLATTAGTDILTIEEYLELKRRGTEFTGQSFLFWEYMRILTAIREKYNPEIFFLLENVKMSKKWETVFNEAIGCVGNHIDARLVSPQTRYRIYWTNINGGVIPQPEDLKLTNSVVFDCPFHEGIDEYNYAEEHVMEKIIPNTPDDVFDDVIQKILDCGGKAISYPSTRAGIKVTRGIDEKSMALISTCNDGLGKFEDKPRMVYVKKLL